MSSLARAELDAPDPGSGVVHLPPDTLSPSAARSFLEGFLAAVVAETRDVAKLLVSELVTNAVRHAATEVVVKVLVRPASIVVSVTDGSSWPPKPEDLSDDAEAGRGLQLVGALATSWGWVTASLGKRVWFELRTAP